MVFHKVLQAHVRARVEARPAAGLFDKPTESSMIATWSGGAWHVLRSIGMHFSLTELEMLFDNSYETSRGAPWS